MGKFPLIYKCSTCGNQWRCVGGEVSKLLLNSGAALTMSTGKRRSARQNCWHWDLNLHRRKSDKEKETSHPEITFYHDFTPPPPLSSVGIGLGPHRDEEENRLLTVERNNMSDNEKSPRNSSLLAWRRRLLMMRTLWGTPSLKCDPQLQNENKKNTVTQKKMKLPGRAHSVQTPHK